MRECACPKELGNLRQELVTNTVTHRVGCLEQGVDPIGEDVRVLTAGGDEAPMHFCASTVGKKNHNDVRFKDVRGTIFIFFGAKLQKNLHMCKKKCIFALFFYK